MYVFYRCVDPKCGFSAHVSGSRTELDILMGQQHLCPHCNSTLIASTTFQGHGNRNVKKLVFKEFYNAVNGMGFPNETVTHKEPVIAMLKACRVVDVDADEVDGRCIVNSITLDNGVTFYLAASGYGAAVFKATRGGDNASNWTDDKLYKQSVRGRKLAEKHCPRSSGDTSHGSKIHGRVRKDPDPLVHHDKGSVLPTVGGHKLQSKSSPEMVLKGSKGEANWVGRKTSPCTTPSKAGGKD